MYESSWLYWIELFKINENAVEVLFTNYTNFALFPTKLKVHVPKPAICAFIYVLKIVIMSNILQNEYLLDGMTTL